VKSTTVVVNASQPPRGPKGGVKKGHHDKNAQNASKGKHHDGKNKSGGHKGGKKSTYTFTSSSHASSATARILTVRYVDALQFWDDNRLLNGTVNKPKPKTQEELDLEIDAYTMGKEAALSAKLDAEMDAYRTNRTNTEASSAPES